MSGFHPDRICLWEFPEADWPAWCELVGPGNRYGDYDTYLAVLAGLEADQTEQGRRVVRVKFGVAEMRRRLKEAGLYNQSDQRAAVIGAYPESPII